MERNNDAISHSHHYERDRDKRHPPVELVRQTRKCDSRDSACNVGRDGHQLRVRVCVSHGFRDARERELVSCSLLGLVDNSLVGIHTISNCRLAQKNV